MDQHDKSFMTTFVVILSILILITVVLIFGANLVAKLSVQPDDGVRRLAVANERIKPVAQVFVTGQERPKTAAPTAVPVKVAQVQQTGEQIYTGKCAACHVAGVLGAPKLVKSDWEPRFAQGLDTLVSHAVNGIRSMPAKGGHPDLTEQDIRNSVIYMLKTSGIAVAEEEVTAPAEVAPEPPVTAPVVAVAPPPVAPEQALVATTPPPVQPIETPPPPAVATTPPLAAPVVPAVEPQVPVIAAVPPPASPATVPPGVSAPPVVTAADTSALATLTAQATAAAAQASAAAAQAAAAASQAAAAASQAAAAASQAAAAAAQVAQAVSSAPASTPAPTEAPTPVPVPTEATPPTPTVAPSAPAQPAPVPPAKAAEPAALAPPVVPEPPAPKALPPVTTPVPQAVPPVALTTPSPATAAITLPEGLDLVRGQQTYNTACIVCHLSGVAGSPKLGDKAAWQPRLAQGFETLVKHALQGYKGMPARGARMDIPDQEIINAIGYMVVESQ